MPDGSCRRSAPRAGSSLPSVRLPREPRGASLSVTNVETGDVQVVYQDKNRNVLAGAWSPDGERIIFGIGGFAAFFDGFHSQFLKAGDRVEGGAQVAIVNADGTGFQELTSGSGQQRVPVVCSLPTASDLCTGRSPRTGTGCAS